MFAPEQPMKTVFITYNQAYHEIIVRLLTKMSLRGYTSFERAQGRGSKTGEPHIGGPRLAYDELGDVRHRLPMTTCTRAAGALRALDEATPDQGLRASSGRRSDD